MPDDEDHPTMSAARFARDYPELAAEIDRIRPPESPTGPGEASNTPGRTVGPLGWFVLKVCVAGAGIALIVRFGIRPWWLVVPGVYVLAALVDAIRVIETTGKPALLHRGLRRLRRTHHQPYDR
jgi:hypothetical protein